METGCTTFRALKTYTTSTIGTKQLVGITGLGLSLFLLLHMAGNLFILEGAEAYNSYSHKLVENPLLEFAEAGLVLIFLIHVFKAIIVTMRNKSARPVSNSRTPHGEKFTTPVSKTLLPQGLIILVFVILHLATFKYGPHYTTTYKGEEIRDLYKLVVEVFHNPVYVAWYVVALLVLSLHLGHGVYSCFQTLGLNHPKYTPLLKAFGFFYTVVVSGGFIILPLYVYFLKS